MADAPPSGPRPAFVDRFLWVSNSALAISLFMLLVLEIASRIGFRCDLLMWSESPFMTDMMKLAQGLPIYTAPADLNSYIYSPGLEYLTYALLAPIGLALDVRFCRLVNVLIGMAAALCAALVMAGVEADLREGPRDRRLLVVSFSTAALVVFSSQTSDGLHPDNLHLLHASATLLVCYEALRRGSVALGAVAIGIAAFGVAVKQPAALAPLGVSAALALAWRRQPGRLPLLLGTGAVACIFACWFVFADVNRRFFIFDLPTAQSIVYSNAVARLDAFFRGHRLLLSVVAPVSVLTLAPEHTRAGRSFLVAWLAVGIAEVAPSILPVLKVGGIDNNFTVMALWLLVVAGAGIGSVHGRPEQSSPDRRLLSFVLGCVTAGILVSLVPLKLAPSADSRRYCDALIGAVGADLRAGRRVLLSRGTTPFLANGISTAPLDREPTLGEFLLAGRLDVLESARRRLATGYYDRLYLMDEFLPAVLQLPKERYQKVAGIPRPSPAMAVPRLVPLPWPIQRFSQEIQAVTIYERTR
jgi:hypothetical protein